MSEDLETVGDLNVTSFYGGSIRGPCLQFTPVGVHETYAQLTRQQVNDLMQVLGLWLVQNRGAADSASVSDAGG